MKRPRIEEVNYQLFRENLQAASDVGGRIDKSDRQRWKAYVKENGVREAACMSFGKSRAEDVKPVIINSSGPWDGFYVYSETDEFVLKFVPAAADPAAPVENAAAGGDVNPAAAGDPDAPAEDDVTGSAEDDASHSA